MAQKFTPLERRRCLSAVETETTDGSVMSPLASCEVSVLTGFMTVSEKGLARLAKRISSWTAGASQVKPCATLVVLSGNLGSGKTTFIKYLARAFKIKSKVHSPTFVFVHEYHFPKSNAQFLKLIHIDAYRMEKRSDVAATGIKQYLKDPQNLVLIEWGERISKWIPKPDLTIKFLHHTPKLRKIRLLQN